MRCREALKRLNQIPLSQQLSDPDLVAHLRGCSDCAQKAQASQLIAQDLFQTAAGADQNITPLAFLKTKLESQKTRQKESNYMSQLIRNMPAHKRLGVSLTAVFVILLALSVIPFSFNKTVGYEVAFAGVNKDLAMDQEKINIFLEKLGIENAEVEVSDCTETCKLTITDLKSPADAQIIKAALLKSANVEILHDIEELTENEKNTIFGNVIKEFQGQQEFEVRRDQLSDEDAIHIVIEKLGEDVKIDTLVFFEKGATDVSGFLEGQLHELTDSMNNKEFVFKSKANINEANKFNNIIIGDNNGKLQFEGQELALKNGQLDQATIERLEAMGYSVETIDKDGTKQIVISGKDENGAFTEEHIISDDDDAAAKVGELPISFELGQNYPNPFNPTTNIDFTLPTAEHVMLQIINVRGQVVKTLLDQQMSAGSHTIEWNATDQSGSKVASGIYIYRIVAGKYNATKKMSLIK